jgi:large subunit ribosomal protein L7Ae
MNIPYCFVKGKAALGKLVHQKNATAVALTEVRKEDEGELNNLASAFRTHYNENKELEKTWGGFKRGFKSEIKYKKVEAEREREAFKKLNS